MSVDSEKNSPSTSSGQVTSLESPQEETNSPPSSDLSPQEKESQVSVPEPQVSQKTQGMRVSRGGGAEVLAPVAERAARSGRRNDVHAYMRLRRSYV